MSKSLLRQPALLRFRSIVFSLLLAALFAASALAQSGDREARAALWDGYKLPEGEFTRFVDRQKGYSFWYPLEWKTQLMQNGTRMFQSGGEAASQGTNVLVITEDIPEGYGIANYTTGYLQSLRSQPVVEDSTTVRRVMLGGLEWREVAYDLESGGQQFHQTMWLTAVGPRVYGFALTLAPNELGKYEPLFKRMLMSVRIAATGRFDEEFETLRAKFAANAKPAAGSESAAAGIAEDLRAARIGFDTAVNRLTQLFAESPEAAFDLTADSEPHVRAAAILALGKARRDAAGLDALLWALTDKDVFAANAAAGGVAARGQDGLSAFKNKLPALAETPSVVVRAGLAFNEDAARELIAVLLAGDNGKQQLTGMLLALALPKFDQPLPFAKLIASAQAGQAGDGSLWNATIAVLQKHFRGTAAASATAELSKLLRGDSEWWAAHALGEIAPIETAAELERRIAEIDARLTAMGKAKPAATNGKSKPRRNKASANTGGILGTVDSSAFVWVGDPKSKPEDVRLALARGQAETAVRKIKFRANWNKAQTDAERRKLRAEFKENNYDLSKWAESVTEANEAAPAPTAAFDAAKLDNAPTTGETLFPKHALSYVMSPNFAATMDRLDAALSGVQMATVRDQMTFALIYKLLKASLADKTGTTATGDAGKAVGIDLKSPISLATWTGANGKTQSLRSAVAVRVNDRARFERTLATYQEELGDLNTFATVTAALSRFAGLLPAAIPVIFAAMDSPEGNQAIGKRLPKSAAKDKTSPLQPFAWVRQERLGGPGGLGGVPVTVFDKPTISGAGATWETIYVTYLGDTAVIASSQAALADALKTASGEASIAQSEGFAKLRANKIEAGEIVFFSDLPGLIRSLDSDGDLNKDGFLEPLLKPLGTESGALRLSQTSWETVFNLTLGDNQFTGSFKPFNAAALSAPRELLPHSTILYAAANVDPPKLMEVIKKLAADSGSGSGAPATKPAGTVPGASATGSAEIERIIEKDLVPQMQGEIAGAILSLKPFFDGGEMPAMVFAAKLKSKDAAQAMRAGKLFAKIKRLENTTVLGSPVISLSPASLDAGEAPFAIVTDDYFVLADSVDSLKMLEAKERFAASRDYARSLQNLPDSLALFATYNLEAAFDEAGKAMSKSEASQQMLPLMSAVVHAFHSQRAFVAFDQSGNSDNLRGNLAVSFDREGRYTIGDLAARSADFDVANAIIPTKGLSVLQSPRVESMTLRIKAKGDGVAPRVRDDLAKFPWQKIESSNDAQVVVTAAARRIPEKLTVKLPVAGEEFKQYLRPSPRINSVAPEVVALAKQIAGEDKDARSVARKIGDWTYQNLKWKKVESDAVETLASREADCLEHSELYVALARSLGLPARVVTGAAFGGGSFGAHAWVEVYLGKWVELDPTWGLMEHVDATHLRFDGDAFTSYAMLNQLELEITAARRTVAEFQRDPLRLVKEFSLDEATRDLAFDLPLTVEHTLGAERWNKLDEKQRAAVIKAFERSVKELWETWDDKFPEPIRLLRREPKGALLALTVLRGDALLRLTLAERDGAWFITEHENLDDALPEFADALNGALQPEAKRGRIYEVAFEPALKHLDRLIANEGEKAELLLLKAKVLSLQQSQARLEKLMGELKEAGTEKPVEEKSATAQPAAADPAVELMKQIVARQPQFAPGHLALGRELLNQGDTEDSLTPISKDTEQAIAALRRYAELVPDDPRPWRDLGQAFEQTEQFDEAEKAYRAAIERDRTYLDHHAMLVNFLLDQEALDKAKTAFAAMLKAAPEPHDAFEYLSDEEEGFDADSAKIREELLLAFPKEVSTSKTALLLLADLQEAQDKFAEAVKSTQRALAIEAEAEDYYRLSRLYRQQRRFTEALNAANQGLKLDDSELYLHFERACSLAQLGRKREALAALKQLAEGDETPFFNADEPDLQPLATMPEFKAMKDKMKAATPFPPEKQEEQSAKPTKP